MKYPQLVSTRAVNAISDWLVSRLEQLGVEAPQIYTRLLLSLLQSSVQINDPIEFSNLETFFANRKGNNRRHLPCDTDTLKKLNAIQCLKEIVSSEQEIAAIENLVDELCDKIRLIEKQSADIENEDKLLVASVSVPNDHLSHHNQQHHYNNYNNSKKHHRREEQLQFKEGAALLVATATAATVTDIETDPKKRYFRAFPALSKEMEDSFRIWRRNAKSLTWPMDRNNISSVSSSSSSSTISTSFGSEGAPKVSDEYVDAKVTQVGNLNIAHVDRSNRGSGGLTNLANYDNSTFNSGGVKRKTKRRRNQALLKGKTIQNIRKNSISNTTTAGVGGAFTGVKCHRNSSPTWDTDFEGCWEMGRDLIKEFIVKQNKNNRNRSTSESAAYSLKAEINNDTNIPIQMKPEEHNDCVSPIGKESSKASSPILPVVDISFCCDDEGDDTLASVSEMASDNSMSAAAPARRLYQRDISFGSRELKPDDIKLCNIQSDFAKFEAKFDSNVEALWKDADPISKQTSGFSFGPTSLQNDSLPAVASFKENLKSFWTNYYNQEREQQQQQEKQKHQQPQQAIANCDISRANESSVSLSCHGTFGGSGSSNTEIANTSDYYSMPSTLDDFDRSVGSIRRDFGKDAVGDQTTSIGVFFQNSIWSENPSVGGAGDTDESFYYKVWSSTQKLNQLDAIHGGKITSTSDLTKTYDNMFNIPPYNIHLHSKWSEGINAGPNMQQQTRIRNDTVAPNIKNTSNTNLQNLSIDCTDSNAVPLKSNSSYNWQTPTAGQILQADLQSWSQSNPMSLTEMYSNNVSNPTEAIEPKITLVNHSTTASGFIEYARIKSLSTILKQESAKIIYPPVDMRPKEHYAEDENLLTSERTHFHPIKAYSDGHTFDICSSLDVIDYERSASGYLYLEAEKYLEYTRNDNLTAEEDGFASTTPLYASSNCEAAHARSRIGNKTKVDNDFIIKFRMQNSEIACQTENDIIKTMNADNKRASQIQILETHPFCMILSNAAKSINVQTGGTKVVTNDAIEILNKAVAAATVATCLPADNHLFPTNALSNANYSCSQPSIWTAVQLPIPDENCCDEVDFYAAAAAAITDTDNESLYSCNNMLEQQWSMHTIGKKCQLRGHNSVDNNNVNATLHGDSQTLWSMCAACNSEFKSVPANRLLRDELQVEADEIMSDLKYMQDLYIGQAREVASDSDWEADDELDDKDVLPLSRKVYINHGKEDGYNEQKNMHCTPIEDLQQPETQEVLQKVNRFIADLLHQDNIEKVGHLAEVTSANKVSKCFSGGLWCSRNERNIWQQNDIEVNAMKPIELLRRHFNVETHTSAMQAEKDEFLSQLSWEHDHLAEIWQKNEPAEHRRTSTPPIINDVAVIAESVASSSKNEIIIDEMIADKNLRNMQTNSTKIGERTDKQSTLNISFLEQRKPQKTCTSSTATVAAYKRVQQFLNANLPTNAGGKLKIPNRKRRHSASQNFFHNSQLTVSANNNNIDIADLNKYNIAVHTANITSSADLSDDIDMQKYINCSLQQHPFVKENNSRCNDVDYKIGVGIGIDEGGDNDGDSGDGGDGGDGGSGGSGNNNDSIHIGSGIGGIDGFKQPEQTIITCKYWTTIDAMPVSEDVLEGATFSCLIDKNASILKHVTLVTRPLTR